MEKIWGQFGEVETAKEYDGYYYQITDIIRIVALGSLCGLKNKYKKALLKYFDRLQ